MEYTDHYSIAITPGLRDSRRSARGEAIGSAGAIP